MQLHNILARGFVSVRFIGRWALITSSLPKVLNGIIIHVCCEAVLTRQPTQSMNQSINQSLIQTAKKTIICTGHKIIGNKRHTEKEPSSANLGPHMKFGR